QLAELVRRCKVFICSDTAVLHAAAAVGTRCVVFFGPTDPVRHVCADDPAKGHVIMYKDLKCSPCYKGHCYTRKCLKTISVDEVLAEVFKILDSK
ncbi:MAG: 3-deoxy-D-manno-octulosonic acid transferase, partial [Candidatus Omnitrophica bacterium]|nr:3-deoxy-D-manno-octulosonic acid transferase [Candidatus Omnitrophota bacterium]